MLYVTTREKYDAFTTARTLVSSVGPDGGLYLPYKMPLLTAEELETHAEQSFGQNVAAMLNRFFGCGLSGWDVEFSIGRYPVKLAAMGQKILMAECWRNLEGSYEKLERHLAARICRKGTRDVVVTSWLRIAIRIALLTGVFGEMRRNGFRDCVDIAVPDGDFSLAMAVWYGREMGLPVANIIVGCGDGSDAWNLLHNGQLRSGAMPELERLIYGTLGIEAAQRLGRGESISLRPDQLQLLRKGLFSAVVSKDRRDAAIPNVYSTNSYILEPNAAVAYSALMDYRARTGEGRVALILEDTSPAEQVTRIAAALGLTADRVKELLR